MWHWTLDSLIILFYFFITLLRFINFSQSVFIFFTKKRSSLIYNTRARHQRHEWDTSDTNATRVLQERHECDTSATWTTRARQEWKSLILITTRVKTYFHTLILTIWQVKDYKERNNFILRTNFGKCLVSTPKCV